MAAHALFLSTSCTTWAEGLRELAQNEFFRSEGIMPAVGIYLDVAGAPNLTPQGLTLAKKADCRAAFSTPIRRPQNTIGKSSFVSRPD